MYKLTLFLGICLAFASGSKPTEKLPANHSARLPGTDNKCQKIVGCYYTNNEDEQMDETLNIEMIDVSICTHLFYSTAALNKNGSVQVREEYVDIDMNGFQRINNLRKKSRHLKTLINMKESFTDDDGNKIDKNKVLFDPILRETFVNNVVNFVEKYKFNGIELESLHLAENNIDASDKQNFVLLLKALKTKFDKKGLILFLAVDARESTAKKYDIEGISKYVSFINLRAYNFHGDRTYDAKKIAKASHIAPLYHSPKESTEEQKLNVEYIVKYWLSQHAPPNKLILGTTFVALSYNLANPKKFGRDAPVVQDPKYDIPLTSYYYTCEWKKDRLWTTFWDKEQQVPYIHEAKQMIACENVNSIKIKAEYAKKMKLGGVFADSIEQDDFNGHCGGEKFTLLKAMSRVLRDKC